MSTLKVTSAGSPLLTRALTYTSKVMGSDPISDDDWFCDLEKVSPGVSGMLCIK